MRARIFTIPRDMDPSASSTPSFSCSDYKMVSVLESKAMEYPPFEGTLTQLIPETFFHCHISGSGASKGKKDGLAQDTCKYIDHYHILPPISPM